ncbi:MAG: M6 family metalloprotease domain-containing protein [candidate division Zixibacteria bacterium]|nr:M6 family metalloprotease domain-containing protein [candidate division Zixibacteria bacterium]
MSTTRLTAILGVFMLLFLVASHVLAVAPTPEAVEKWKAEGVWEQKVANWNAFKKAGGCSPEIHTPFDRAKRFDRMALGEQAADTAYVIVILVDFTDNPHTGGGVNSGPEDFDSLLFSNRETDLIINPTGSMTDYYLENSYGQFYVKGDIYGWYTMPETYAWYVGADDGAVNSSVLAKQALDSAYANGADFSKYDRNGDTYCDGVIIIHAGPGAEEGAYGIWSHKANIVPPRVYDGVTVEAYTMNPEESGGDLSPIGVFCHEYGHFLGLSDLYDVNYDPPGSYGLGKWSLMASGNYNGGSQRPAHLDGWSKVVANFASYTIVNENLSGVVIPQVETDPVIYFLGNAVGGGSQYWVVENRQKTGFDLALPGEGLCIYHIDMAGPLPNNDPERYRVALEQADGNDDLAYTVGNYGDASDPWPGSSNNRNFHDLSSPNSRLNVTGVTTQIGVWNISNPDSLMTADFDVEYSRPYTVLTGPDSIIFDDSQEGNGDGIITAGETVNFYFTVKNLMRHAYNPRASLSSSNPDVQLLTNDVPFATDLDAVARSNFDTGLPIKFKMADEFTPIIDSFILTITADSVAGVAGSENYSKTFGIEVSLGAPQILIVDDDQGDDYDEIYREMVYLRRIPHQVWHSDASGSPTGTELGRYPMVFWHTGQQASGSLGSSDISALKEYLGTYDGQLFLSGFAAVPDIQANDPSFLTDYLHTNSSSTSNWYVFKSFSDNPVTGGTKYRYGTVLPKPFALLEPLGDAQGALYVGDFGSAKEDRPDWVTAVTYDGAYKTFLMTFPFEYIGDLFVSSGYATKDTLLNRVIGFFGGTLTSVWDGRPFAALPISFDLNQNYPNPFNPSTVISYTLRTDSEYGTRPAKTNLAVYNMLGQKVKTLVDEVQLPGNYSVEWNSTNTTGKKVASGVYFYKLTRGNDAQARKMILLK